jgi:predicted nucleic acid-binding protein
LIILFDLNVVVDVAVRWQTYPHSLTLYTRMVRSPLHTGALPACGYTTLYYLLQQWLSREDARAFLAYFRHQHPLLPFTDPMAQAAHRLAMRDLEDACVAITALEHQCDLIATRNVRDFQGSPIPAKTPEDILALL